MGTAISVIQPDFILRRHYNWRRYWRPRGAPIHFSEDGFLFSPGKYNPRILPFEEIADAPALVLMGEPGIGKSAAMKAERDAIELAAVQAGDQVLFRDLRSYGTRGQVVDKIFGHPKFQAWVGGSHRLHLLLDSFDECRLEVKQLAAVLADELRDYEDARARLVLRIASRTADWSSLLETALKEIWGDEAVRAYELAPLTRDDVRVAATEEGIDPEQFLSDVHYRGVGPLAAKPLTLRLLFNLYHQEGRLPLTQAELYAKGCKLLAAETSQSYLEAGHLGSLAPARRMAVAGRIAAVTVFGQKDAIWTGADFGDVPEGDVTPGDLSGGKETAGGESFEVGVAAVDEVSHTGLFTSRGISRLGWAHQTYAEFLAAWHLTQLELTSEQTLALIVHPEDPDGKLVPQLHETAAWLAGMRPDVFQEILRREPKVLLRSDVAAADPTSRAALTAALLNLYEEERDFDTDWFVGARYQRLNHPDIARQLRPYIKDREKGFMVRRVAIEVAGACQVRELQGDLADVALAEAEILDIRLSAARAVADAGDAETKARLRPLAEDRAGADTEHRLKAIALEALWPEQLSAGELFSLLTTPGANDSGLYGSFLAHSVTKHLRPEDLPTAVRWTASQGSYHHLNYYVSLLVNQIMLLAWENLGAPGVLEVFARAALLRLQRHDPIIEERAVEPSFSTVLAADDEKCRLLIRTMLPMVVEPEKAGLLLQHMGARVARGDDVPWLLKSLLEEEDEAWQLAWASVIRACWHFGNPDQLELIYLACQVNPAMARTFRYEFRAVPLDSHEAEEGRKIEAMRRERDSDEEAQERHEPLDPPPAARISDLLAAGEAGDPDAWWNLNIWLRAEEDGTAAVSEEEPDLKVYPGWQQADLPMRRRLIAAAKRYLLERGAQTDAWINETDIIHRPAAAGYRALRLLLAEDTAFVLGLTAETWKRWAPITLAYLMPFEVSDEEKDYQRRLVGMAYQHAPEEIIKTLMVDLDRGNRERGSVTLPEALAECWDRRLREGVMAKAKEPDTQPLSLHHLLRALATYGGHDVRAFAESFLRAPLPADPVTGRKAVVAAYFLLEHYAVGSWQAIWSVVARDAEFGRGIVERIAPVPGGRSLRLVDHLNAEEIADLYIWVVLQYPYAEDPDTKGMHQLSTREMVARWRDSLVYHLKDLGTPEACDALQRVAAALPDLKIIKRFLLEAQSLLRRRTWRAPSPAEIINLSAEQHARLSLREERRRAEEAFRAVWVLECALEGDEKLGDTCGQGTAFMLSGIGLVTCLHVLCPHVKAFRADAPEAKYKIEVVVRGDHLDLAVLRLVGVSDPAELVARWSPPVERTERVIVVGFPNYNEGNTGVLRAGEVVGSRPEMGVTMMLINVPIVAGNSGGPVLDGENRVVGVAAKGVDHFEEAHSTEKHAFIPVTELRKLLHTIQH